MNLLTAVNPGQYTALEFDATYLLYGILISAVLSVLVIVAIGIVFARRGEFVWGYMTTVSIIVILCGSLVGITGAQITEYFNRVPQTQAAETKYQSSVRTWLADDFKIVATADEARALAAGETMATQVNGAPTVVHIIPATGGLIALVDSGEHVITPVN